MVVLVWMSIVVVAVVAVVAAVLEYRESSFEIEIKSSPASVLIKEAAKIEKGSGEPHVNKVGKITMDQCREIAKEKGEDLNSHDIDAGAMIIAGTARSMGVEVEGD